MPDHSITVTLEEIPDFLKMLEVNYTSFSKQNKRVAAYFLHHHLKAAFQTVAEVAKGAGVSPATVIRFATTLGFEGYTDLQQTLQSIVQKAFRRNEVLRVDPVQTGEPLTDTIEVSLQALNELKDVKEDHDFHEAVDILFSARKIVTIGHKASLGVAAHASYVLSKVHPHVRHVQSLDEFDSFSAFEDMGKDDAALVFAVIHYPMSTLRMIRLLAAKGVRIVMVSDFRSFDEIELVAVSLLAPIRFQGFLDIMTPMLALADALAFGVYQRDEVKGKERLKQFNRFNEAHQAFLDVCRFAG